MNCVDSAPKIRLVVMDEHTLGYMTPGSDYISILHTSILKGSYLPSLVGPVLIGICALRLACEADFDEFRVSFKGYDNADEYEFAKDKFQFIKN